MKLGRSSLFVIPAVFLKSTQYTVFNLQISDNTSYIFYKNVRSFGYIVISKLYFSTVQNQVKYLETTTETFDIANLDIS